MDLNAALLGALDESDDEEEEWRDDPLFRADVLALVKAELRALSTDAPYFKATLAELSGKEIAFMNDLFTGTAASARQ